MAAKKKVIQVNPCAKQAVTLLRRNGYSENSSLSFNVPGTVQWNLIAGHWCLLYTNISTTCD